MKQINAILINSNERIVKEVSIPNLVKSTELFKAIYKLLDIDSYCEFDNCTNLYDENISFHSNSHNIYQKRFHEKFERAYIKTNNTEIFISKLESEHLYLLGKILIIGEVKINKEQIVTVYPLKFSINEVLSSFEWKFDKQNYSCKMSKSELQAEAEEILRTIQSRYC